jgi:hypothetical protein
MLFTHTDLLDPSLCHLIEICFAYNESNGRISEEIPVFQKANFNATQLSVKLKVRTVFVQCCVMRGIDVLQLLQCFIKCMGGLTGLVYQYLKKQIGNHSKKLTVFERIADADTRRFEGDGASVPPKRP